jgi:hypothetical protein
MKKKILSILIVCFLVFLSASTSGFSTHSTTISRSFDRYEAVVGEPITVTVIFTNEEAYDLRGFYYTEQIPEQLWVDAVNIRVDGSDISYLFESGSSGEIYPGSIPYWWVIEIPTFAENNPIPENSTVVIVYHVTSSEAGTFNFDEFNWVGYYQNAPEEERAALGHSEEADNKTITFSQNPDSVPPVRLNGTPTGTLPSGTTETTLSLSTNEDAICRYDTSPGVDYYSMLNTFFTTGGTVHSESITGLTDGGNYTYYVKCEDSAGNANPDDYTVSFSVAEVTEFINWGQDTNLSTSIRSVHSRTMGGISPDVDNLEIKSISIYLGEQAGDIRLAVYTGGSMDDPSFATLLWDAGTVNSKGTAGWYTINHPIGSVFWPKNTVTWLAWKRNTGVAVYTSKFSADAGDFQAVRGRNQNSFNTDPGVAFPDTYGVVGVFSNYWYSIYVSYTTGASDITTP